MELVVENSFVPTMMVLASPECKDTLYQYPLFQHNSIIKSDGLHRVRLCTAAQVFDSDGIQASIDVESLVKDTRSVVPNADFQSTIMEKLVNATLQPTQAQSFETFGHPITCVLAVSSKNPSPISALTQLYQQSYLECPASISPDFLRCVWYIQDNEGDSNSNAEDYETVASQFGPHCFRLNGYSADDITRAAQRTANQSVYPFMERVVKEWQLTGNAKGNSGGFGFGKLLKKLVHSGPPRPEYNLFFEACAEMQPHVASIPAPRKNHDLFNSSGVLRNASAASAVDMQMRRLADVAFMLKDYRLALSAYDSLRKSFHTDQKWAHLGGCCEMSAITTAMLRRGDVGAAVDTALYTYNSRINLPGHFLRCVLLVCGCLTESGDQLLAAGLLSTALIEIDPVFGSGQQPAETAMLMEQISGAFENRKWLRKAKLWNKLAESEWARSNAQQGTPAAS